MNRIPRRELLKTAAAGSFGLATTTVSASARSDFQTSGSSNSLITTARPREIDDPLVNPYCGWGICAGPRFYNGRRFSVSDNTTGFGNDAPLFSWVLIDWMWSDLEPREGHFEWKDFDTTVEFWKARHKQLIVRLWVTTDPGWAGAPGNKACPDWLWAAGVKFHEYQGEGGVKQQCPAYADPSWDSIYCTAARWSVERGAE